MTAGKGIVHSERTGQDIRAREFELFGIQSWIALPKHLEEQDPAFEHIGKTELPELSDEGKVVRLIAGEAYGLKSPLKTASSTLYADIILKKGAKLPISALYQERGVFPLHGAISIDGVRYDPSQLLVLREGDEVTVTAEEDVRLMLMGGDMMDGPRHIWWNFVSSSKERIEQAKEDWKQGRFPDVPNDVEYIPLPE